MKTRSLVQWAIESGYWGKRPRQCPARYAGNPNWRCPLLAGHEGDHIAPKQEALMGSMSSKSDGSVWILDSGPGGREFGVYQNESLARTAAKWYSMGGYPLPRVTKHDIIQEVTVQEEK